MPTLDTESPPKVMRRLDYSNDEEVNDSNDNNKDNGIGATKAQQQPSFTSPMPTSPQSRSRNTLSSRTSLLGRRLAEERSKNHQLTIELEHVKSLLKRNNNDNIYDNDDVFSLNEIFYSSSPVNTPTATPVKQQPDRAAAVMEEDDDNCKNELLQHKQRIQELENALQTTQTNLISAEQYAASLEEKMQKQSFIGNDSAIHEYMERASLLICNSSFTTINTTCTPNNTTSNGYKNNGSHHSYNSLHSIDEDDEEEDDGDDEDDEDEDEIIDNTEKDAAADATTFDISQSNLLNKMQEYEELVTSFHLEQQSNLDETMTKEDILWFFGELKWRFANIHHGVAKLSKEVLAGNNNCDASSKTQQDNIQELKDCLTGLIDELNYSMQKTRENKSNDNNDVYQREAIKQRYEEQLASQRLRIQQLEKDVTNQEEHFSEIQKKMKNDYHLIEEEKRKLALSKDGTAARIRYLEDMLKKAQTTKSADKKKDDCGRNGNGYASEIDTLAKALTDSELRRALLIEEFQAEREKYITQYKQMNDVLKSFMDNPL